MDNLNLYIDGAIIIILLITFFIGAYRGIMKTIFKTFSSVISLTISFSLHPIVSRLVRATPIFDVLKSHIADKLGLDLTPVAMSQPEQSSLIASLPLPDFLIDALVENNNSVVHSLLDVHGIADYICGYIANIIINISVTIILTIIVIIIMKVITRSLNIISRLPIIHQFNYLGGGLVGLITGVIIIWVVFMVLMLFVTAGFYTEFLAAIDNSLLGKILFENNILNNLIMGDLFNG